MLPFLEHDKDLLKYSSFHTPATARYFFELREKSDIEKLPDIWEFAQENNLPIVFLGSGTNVVFAFDVFEGVIVRNTTKGIEWNGNTVRVAGGELISPLSLQIMKEVSQKGKDLHEKGREAPSGGSTEGIVLLRTMNEEAELGVQISTFSETSSLFGKWVGLPGTIGGAVTGNAGCFGFETKDAIIEATIFDMETGEYRVLKNTELDFSYRHSLLKDRTNWFLIDAIFRTDLVSSDATDPRTFRSGKQPGGFTCGSFFRNPPGDSAGRLIDQVGLKGHRIGGVKISELHANFFVNDEKGSHKDILALRDLAKEKVREMFGVELREEARIIENK